MSSARRTRLLLSVCPLVVLVACPRGEEAVDPVSDTEEKVVDIPPPTSQGTLRALGPHIFEATFDRAGDRQGSFGARETTARLSWDELDSYSYREIEGGRLVRDEIRVEGDLWQRAGETSPYQRHDGMPGDSRILFHTLRLFDSALAPFASQVAFERQDDDTIEGRPVRTWRLGLAPAPTAAGDRPLSPEQAARMLGRATTALSLSGLVSVDAETGNRLLAEIEGRFLARPDLSNYEVTDEVLVTYRERRILLDEGEFIRPPPPDRVKERKRAAPSFLRPDPTPPRRRPR